MFRRFDPFGNPNTGVYMRATDKLLFVPPGLTDLNVKDAEAALGLEAIKFTIGGSTLLGSLMAANSRGIVVADAALPHEIEVLETTGLKILRLAESRLNAAGNNILVGEKGVLVHPHLSSEVQEAIARTFGVPLHAGSIAEISTVGTAAVVTTRGVLAHPRSTEQELQFLSQIFGHQAQIGTVNHGHGLVGAGVVANVNGVVAGTQTTGIELGRIENALGFLNDEEE